MKRRLRKTTGQIPRNEAGEEADSFITKKKPILMKFFQLLRQRDALLRQARLANLVFAYHRLSAFAERIARAQLCGKIHLQAADSTEGRPWPVLETYHCSQAVLEEHFLDEDILELTDILTFLSEEGRATEFVFQLEELENQFMTPLRRKLEDEGISLDLKPPSIEDAHREQE